MSYTIIRDLSGSWPQWIAKLDDGRIVFIYVRHGFVNIGLGGTVDEAMENAVQVEDGEHLAGVTDVVDALVILRKNGYLLRLSNFNRSRNPKSSGVTLIGAKHTDRNGHGRGQSQVE